MGLEPRVHTSGMGALGNSFSAAADPAYLESAMCGVVGITSMIKALSRSLSCKSQREMGGQRPQQTAMSRGGLSIENLSNGCWDGLAATCWESILGIATDFREAAGYNVSCV